jgi:two-component system phosphate regulon response regulator OmpR
MPRRRWPPATNPTKSSSLATSSSIWAAANCKNQQVLSLTTAEFAVLTVLATHPRRPLTREQLMEMALGKGNGESLDRSIDVHISRLRKTLEGGDSPLRFIQTVWGYGYVFVPDGSERE